MSRFKKKKKRRKKSECSVKTLVTRDTFATSVLKESSPGVKEGAGVGVLRPSTAPPPPHASTPHPGPTSGKFPKSSKFQGAFPRRAERARRMENDGEG